MGRLSAITLYVQAAMAERRAHLLLLCIAAALAVAPAAGKFEEKRSDELSRELEALGLSSASIKVYLCCASVQMPPCKSKQNCCLVAEIQHRSSQCEATGSSVALSDPAPLERCVHVSMFFAASGSLSSSGVM